MEARLRETEQDVGRRHRLAWGQAYRLVVMLLLLVLLAVPAMAAKARNVILFIGDGMGPSQVSLAALYSKEIQKRPLRMLDAAAAGRMGIAYTSSANALVTDSAAAATALATGFKTNNGVIGLDAEGKRVPTILELARDRGLRTGLVATASITHATPAGFAAHVSSRGSEFEIAAQMADARIDVLLGGGLGFFRPKDQGGERTDGQDLVERLRAAGCSVLSTRQELADSTAPRMVGLFGSGALSPAFLRERDAPGQPRLAEMTDQAIRALARGKRGFFLMVEGSQIDWRCHANEAVGALHEVLELDEAVGVALDFARRRRDTLVLVTADHETGGMTLTAGGEQLQALAKAALPLDAAGLANGMTAAQIAALTAEKLSLPVPEAEIGGLLGPTGAFDQKAHGLPLLRLMGGRCGVSWTTTGHTATPVYLIGYGPGSERIQGVQENTATFTIMRRALGL
ncbi:MAG: alkaline phosphatase [Armatimonadetes bacterium]|nr:alkaline phosphatase [Armatimonadota bacterium]